MGIRETGMDIRAAGQQWLDAERRGDTDALDELATADFTLVGPVGFVLDKAQWLDRYRSGDFSTESLSWDDVTIREYGAAAVAVGTLTQQATYQGHRADGQLRTTHVFVRDGGRWRLAGEHLSPIGGPLPFAR